MMFENIEFENIEILILITIYIQLLNYSLE